MTENVSLGVSASEAGAHSAITRHAINITNVTLIFLPPLYLPECMTFVFYKGKFHPSQDTYSRSRSLSRHLPQREDDLRHTEDGQDTQKGDSRQNAAQG